MLKKTQSTSMWSPLKNSTYAVLFIATVLSNIGTWMHEVGASWKMTEMTQDPAMVALIQTAVSLPIFFFALPAGALADLFNRRKLLITINIVAFFAALSLAILMQFNVVTPNLLLFFTFTLGICTAFIAPTWQAIVPSLVTKDQLTAAVSLNGVGINISRAIGPALAGILIVSMGLQAPFWVNSASFLIIISALIWWSPKTVNHSGLPKEHIIPAMISGIAYAKNSQPLKATMVRAGVFFLPASAFWALLPIIVNQGLDADASLFGISTGLVGVGAVCGALFLPKLKPKYHPSQLVFWVSMINGLLFIVLSAYFTIATLLATCFMFGSAWIIAMANLNVSAQTALPNWVRARGLAVFLTVFFGAMSIGSVIWGNVAAWSDINTTLLIASAVVVIGALTTKRFALNLGSERDLEPALYWPTPKIDGAINQTHLEQDATPVLITIRYSISQENRNNFLAAIEQLGKARKRYGAYQWGVMQDVSDAAVFIEYFFESSWLQHLHHHERTSGDDKRIQEQVNQFHQGNEPPVVSHLIGTGSVI